jgi:hypothetical protein
MKKSEFRTLLREEIRKVMRENNRKPILEYLVKDGDSYSELLALNLFDDLIETPIQNELGNEVMPVVKKYGPIAKQLHKKLMSRKSDILSGPEADMLDDTWFDGNYRDAAEYNRIMPKIFDKQIRALKSIL